MKSEEKRKSTTRRQQTAVIAPSLVDSEIVAPVVKSNSRSNGQGRPGGGNILAVAAPLIRLEASEDTLVDVDAYGDGMAFRFTWS